VGSSNNSNLRFNPTHKGIEVLTMNVMHRSLYYTKTFWGIVKMLKGWRIGLNWGFLEIATGCSGVYLPRKGATKGRIQL